MAPVTWRDRAECRGSGANTKLFFGEDRGVRLDRARTLCRVCPVRRDCLVAGWTEPAGVWGGFTVEERAAMRAKRVQPRDIVW